jgi:hypothetical protein
MNQKLRAWLQRYREHRIRERAASQAARERVEQADRDVNLAGLERRLGGGGGGGFLG